MSDRIDPTRHGRWGIQQYATVRGVEVWTFTTINCGYEHLADAQARATAAGERYRVADRTTGEPVTTAQLPPLPVVLGPTP